MPTPARRTPLNTYRLQLHVGFTFADAAAQLDYLADLGVTDLYLSPILEAVPGSTHGYDVIDPTRISAERGGRDGFEALATAAHARGMGVIIDIVPNHMAIPTPLWLNPALWSALRDGPASPYADWFDIEPGASLVLPNIADQTDPPPDPAQSTGSPLMGASGAGSVEPDEPIPAPGGGARPFDKLMDRDPGDPIPALIASGQLRLADLELPDGSVERVLTLDDQPYPLTPDSRDLALAEAVAGQRYSLQRWQGDHTRLTHRRFFDIVTLIGVQQELPHVFDATHALLLELFEAGHIDGFRVDHPDGLADPQGYFERLHAATGGAWVVAEKILSGDELLPPVWPVAGTTGYEASWRFDAVQLDASAAEPLARLAQRTDERPDQTWPEVATQAKRLIADGSLASDLDRLTRLALLLDPGLDADSARHCLREFLVALDRYRAYVRPGHPTDATELGVLADATRRARATLADHDHPTLERLHALAAGAVAGLEGDPSPSSGIVAAEFAVRFQQVSGALVAKGVEDTAFYRWTQLLTLCDVGADPDAFGRSPTHDSANGLHSTSTAELHAWLGRVNAGWPAGMSLGSTHDSKRSEDVRARIAAISEYPGEWAELVDALTPLAPDLPPALRTILWQTLAGTWTPAGPIHPDRIAAYLVKAGREQKQWTSWVSPNHDAEAAAAGSVPAVLADVTVQRAFERWVALTQDSVRTNTLAVKLVQLTALGVADIYQGQETVRLSLTDPDNRRPVDFDGLRRLLSAIGPSDDVQLSSHSGSGRKTWQPEGPCGGSCTPSDREPLAEEKMRLTAGTLGLRRRHPKAFLGGSYLPLESTTEFAWGFVRGDEPTAVTIATRLPRARNRDGGWRPADRLGPPPRPRHHPLARPHHPRPPPPRPDLHGWPCALLERIE